MSVKRLEVRQFSAFEGQDFDFADGINVFIGPNGTGKTHIMKVMYSMLATARVHSAKSAVFVREFDRKLAGVFRPEEDDAGRQNVGRLVRRRRGLNSATVRLFTGPTGKARVFAKPAVTFQLFTKGALKAHAEPGMINSRSLFLPTREVLAMYEGFVAAYQERELSFDETYYDACVALGANPLKGPKKIAADRMTQRLRDALGGHVFLVGGRFYVKFRDDRARMEAHLVAEGLRKVAALERLLLNGSLMKNGHLFWDEPEANLNPRLVVVMVDVLAELARAGIQVFLTTHDYLLTKRLSILAAGESFPPTKFFSFFRNHPSEPVTVVEGASLSELPSDNPILQEFANLYELEMERAAGEQ